MTELRRRLATVVAARIFASGTVLISTVAILLATSGGPAAAYGAVNIRSVVVDTTSSNNCRTVTTTNWSEEIVRQSNGCRLDDSVDDTIFLWDAGGEAVKAEFRSSGNLVAKFEFHPNDEELWIYDTRNDGDTIYVAVWAYPPTGGAFYLGTFQVPGTSAAIDIGVVQLGSNGDLAEGTVVDLIFCDDSSCNEILHHEFGFA